jgi:hypothetical protein
MADNNLRFKATMDDQVSSRLDKIRDKFDTLGKSKGFKSLAQGVGIGAGISAWNAVGSAVSGAFEFMGDAIGKASDLNETVSKSNVIFGSNAKSIERWAETMAQRFGQSKRDALDVASTFAGLFDTVGIAEDEAKEKAIKLTELGSDLASFFNTDVQQATEALRSGLAGESEPLRRFNIFLSETAVAAKATQLGMQKVNGQFTEGQKITARYAIILDQTNAAQGDFARTADGLANSQRIVNARLEDQQAILGQKLLPIQLQITKWQIDFIEGLDAVGDALEDHHNAYLQYIADVRTLFDILTFTPKATGFAGDALHHLTGEMGADADSIGVDARDARKSIEGIGVGARITREAVEANAQGMVDAINNAKDDLDKASSAAADAIWDPLIAKAELATNELEQKRQRHLRDAAKAGSQERKDAEDNLLALNKQKFKLLADLAGYGDDAAAITLRNQIKALESQKTLTSAQRDDLARLKKALAAIDHAYDNIYTSARKAMSVNPYQWIAKFGGGARAGGGPVYPNQVYTVGEEGPETLVMNNRGGFVFPGAPASPEPTGLVSMPGRSSIGASNIGRGRTLVVPLFINGRQFARATVPDLDEETYWAGQAAGGSTVEN